MEDGQITEIHECTFERNSAGNEGATLYGAGRIALMSNSTVTHLVSTESCMEFLSPDTETLVYNTKFTNCKQRVGSKITFVKSYGLNIAGTPYGCDPGFMLNLEKLEKTVAEVLTRDFTSFRLKSVCRMCDPGAYNAFRADLESYFAVTSCTLCPAGKKNKWPGGKSEASCKECPLGAYCPEGSSDSRICLPGHACPNPAVEKECEPGFVALAGQTSCSICPAGTRQLNKTSCERCAPGSFSLGKDVECKVCPNGTTSLIGQSYCAPCLAGTFLLDTECLKCTKGTFSIGNAIGKCEFCPPGRYTNKENSGCELCPKGTHGNNSWGLENFDQCVPCPVGTFGSSEGLENVLSCNECPVGKRANVSLLGATSENDMCETIQATDTTGYTIGLGVFFVLLCAAFYFTLRRKKTGRDIIFLLLSDLMVSLAKMLVEVLDIGTDTASWYDVVIVSRNPLLQGYAPLYTLFIVLSWIVSFVAILHRGKSIYKVWTSNMVSPHENHESKKTVIANISGDVVGALSGFDVSAAAELGVGEDTRVLEHVLGEFGNDTVELKSELSTCDDDIKDTHITLLLLFLEDIPMLAVNIAIITTVQEVDTVVYLSTAFNLVMLGVKFPKLVILRDLYKKQKRLREKLEKLSARKASATRVAERRKSSSLTVQSKAAKAEYQFLKSKEGMLAFKKWKEQHKEKT